MTDDCGMELIELNWMDSIVTVLNCIELFDCVLWTCVGKWVSLVTCNLRRYN